jgi:hypothetical protein
LYPEGVLFGLWVKSPTKIREISIDRMLLDVVISCQVAFHAIQVLNPYTKFYKEEI